MRARANDRLSWHRFYAARFDKTGSPRSEHLAVWYLLLHLALDQPEGE